MRRAVVSLVVGTACLLAGPARGDELRAPFATVDGKCLRDPRLGSPQGSTTATVGPFAEEHRAVIVRFEPATGEGTFGVDHTDPLPSRGWSDAGGSFRAGIPTWVWGKALGPGDTSTLDVSCSSSSSFVARWYDVPSAPTTFSGSGWASIAFVAPALAAYQAYVEVSDPPVRVEPFQQTRQSSSGLVPIGARAAGDVVGVRMSGGTWKITFGFAPPAMKQSLVGTPPYTRPGHSFATWFEVARVTKVSGIVVNSRGTVVRTLATDAWAGPFHAGQLVWDGRGPAGERLPDGRYTIRVESHEPIPGGTSFLLSATEASTVLDGTGPGTRMRTPRRASRRGRIRIAASDALSGLEQASVWVDGRRVTTIRPDTTVVSYRPRHGWRTGTHRVLVNARDKVGNVSSRSRGFVISSSHR